MRRRKHDQIGRFLMHLVLATAAVVAATALAAPAFVLAQGAPQTVQLTKALPEFKYAPVRALEDSVATAH